MSFEVPLGATTPAKYGNITQLKAVILADNGRTEANVGFHQGRLAQGFHLLLLKCLPMPDAFEFQGTTLRSGGRFGLPQATETADRQRGAVHDSILRERGASGYTTLQKQVLSRATITGPDRLVKIIPNIRHSQGMTPADQYPMGGGFLQWDLKRPGLPFLYAAFFRPDGVVETAGGNFTINSGRFLDDYPERARLQAFLQTA